MVLAVATAAAVLTASTAGALPPPAVSSAPSSAAPQPAELPREVRGGVELALADGDLLRVWAARDRRTVWAARRDASTATWSARRAILRERSLFCGDVEARTAGGAVAVLAQCDRHGYAEDQAPTASRALWSADTVTWSSYELEGEAYEEPGISPDGTHAVWPQHGRYVTRSPDGFSHHRLDAAGQEYTVTATITDTGLVSFLYGAWLEGRCRLVVLSRTGDAAPSRQELPLPHACQDVDLANADADTVWFGDVTSPAHRAVVSRSAASSPWAVSAIAPADAPGLRHERGSLHTVYATAPGLALHAVWSRGRRILRSQRYDPVTQTWAAPVVVHDAGSRRCRWADGSTAQPLGVVLLPMTCSGRNVVLTTADGNDWRALRMGRHTFGLSPDGRYVAVPGRTVTHVVSAERGVLALPLAVKGRCEVVVPDGPDAAVLLTSAGRHRGWPTVLKASSLDGWRLLSRTRLPTFAQECRGVRSSHHDLPYRFDVFSRRHGYTTRIVQRDGEWTVRRSRW